MKIQKILILAVLSTSLLACESTAERSSNKGIYQENTSANTCSNERVLKYDFQIASRQKLENEKFKLTVTNDYVAVDKYELKYITKLEGGIRVYTMYVTLNVPIGKVEYDLNLDFPDLKEKIALRNNTNMNLNNPNFKLSYTKPISTMYDNTKKSQEYIGNLTLPEYKVKDLTFKVYGEKLLKTKVVSEDTIQVVSEGNQAMIIGYAFKKGDTAYCIGNSYHVSEFNETNNSLIEYFKKD